MYMPVNPQGDDDLLDKLFTSLCSQKTSLVVLDGQLQKNILARVFDEEEAKGIVSKLKSRAYCRIGVARLMPVPAHFSIDLNGVDGKLMELVAIGSDAEQLKRDVILCCQFSFYELKEMQKLIIPFVIKDIGDFDLKFEVDNSRQCTLVYRI